VVNEEKTMRDTGDLKRTRCPRLIRLVFIVCLSACSTGLFAHDIPRIEMVTGEFERVNSVAALPEIIRQFMINKREHCVGLAEPGEKFNSTDEILDETPCQRLMNAGHSADLWWLHYESGGIGHTDHLVIFRLSDNAIANAWTYLRHKPISLDSLVEYVKNGNACLVSPPRESYYREELKTCM
jgi:hypothetical protein